MSTPSSECHVQISPPMFSERASQRVFFGVTALLFVASAAVTIVWCTSMSAMDEMPMPGGWTMSMAWMRMPGQTWLGAAASFRASSLTRIGPPYEKPLPNWRTQPSTWTTKGGYGEIVRSEAAISGGNSLYITGVTSRASSVELIRPPIITHAIGE